METFPLQENVPKTFALEAMTAACSNASLARWPPGSEPWVEKERFFPLRDFLQKTLDFVGNAVRMDRKTYEYKAVVLYLLDFIHRLYGFISFQALKDCFGYFFCVSSLA